MTASPGRARVPSMMATFYLFLICSAMLVAISLVKPHRHTAESEKLVWTSLAEALKGTGARGLKDYRVLAALLFAAMVVLYVLFA